MTPQQTTQHTPFAAIADLREVGTVLNGASRNPTPSVMVLREAVCRIDRAASSIEMDAKALLAENTRLREALKDSLAHFQTVREVLQGFVDFHASDDWYCEHCDRHAPKHSGGPLDGKLTGEKLVHQSDCLVLKARAALERGAK